MTVQWYSIVLPAIEKIFVAIQEGQYSLSSSEPNISGSSWWYSTVPIAVAQICLAFQEVQYSASYSSPNLAFRRFSSD